MQYTNTYHSPLGDILLAADDIGLTGLWFEGQKYFALYLDREHEEKNLPIFDMAGRWLDIYFSGKEPDFRLPLHFTGTDFQNDVWEILYEVPYGQTITYGEIAAKLSAKRGSSRISAHPVGGAVSHNQISVIVPCHRVVGSTGSLTGYAGGIDKKIALLKLENAYKDTFFVPKKGTALVTGASRGIGAAIAEELAKDGFQLILTCSRTLPELETLSKRLEREYGIRCLALQADMGLEADVQRVFARIRDLDVLVNNAGISYVGLLSEMSSEDWRRVMSVNLDSCFYTARAAVPLMLQKHAGRILNISSVWGSAGASMEVAYSASKGGMNAFTKALAKELAPSNIQVNALACGVIDTDMNACLSEEERKTLREEIPADRFGTVQEAAQLALQLLQAPAYLTGQIITLDGGWL